MLCTARDGLRYDDKVLITFNYKEGTETITFGEAVKAEKSSDMSARGAPKIALRKRKAIFIMIAALCECFHLPLTSDRVSGSFCFVGEMQELLV